MPLNPGSEPPRRHENLALALQEILTISARLRSGRQSVEDAAAFRQQVMKALQAANQQARSQGYGADDVKLAIFAVVAFVDESVLNLGAAVFADWPRRPLQEELFGHHVAGEVFFRNLQELLARNDSQELADLLEVYQLCLLLGFAGRYSLGGSGELRAIRDTAAEKIRRIRGAAGTLSLAGAPPPETPAKPGTDPLVRRLAIAAVICLVLAASAFVTYKLMLGSGIASLADLALETR
jgi:type VI secretion system protein ImpK